MQKKILAMLAILTAAVIAANAATVWNPAANEIYPPDTGFWNNADNWTNDVPGIADQKAVFNVKDAAECQVATETPSFETNLVQGDGGPGGVLRVMDGGTITAGTNAQWGCIGWNNTAHLIVETGGLVTFKNHLWVGHQENGVGTIDINGGTLRVDEMFGCNFNNKANAFGFVNVNEGLLSLHNFNDSKSIALGSNVDVKYGKIVFDSNKSGAIAAEVADGRITGFGIIGNVKVEQIDGKTNVTAIADPMNPSPAMYEEVFISENLELSWTNLPTDPEGGDVYVDIWFGTDPADPNYFTKVIAADAGTGEGLNVTNEIVDASAIDTYYWRIDSYLNGPDHINEPNKVESMIYKFTTTDDLAPTVEILTEPTLTWAGEPVNLSAIVTDTGSSPIHIDWTWPNDPNVTVSDIVITETETGVYEVTATAVSDSHQPNKTLTLTAYDDKNGIEKAASDTVLIDFADNPCQGARGGFKRLDLVHLADFDADCVITLADFAVFAAEWLISPDEGRTSFELQTPVAR